MKHHHYCALCYYNKIPKTGWVINNKILLLTFLEVGHPMSRCWHRLFLVRTLFLVHRQCPLTVSSYHRRDRYFMGSLLLEHYFHSLRSYPHDLIAFQRPYFLISSHWALRFQQRNECVVGKENQTIRP